MEKMPKPVQTSLCPACGETLVVLEFQGVEIDYCLSCNGIWLDAGEFELIAEQAGAENKAIVTAFAPTTGKGIKSRRKCPRCLARLRTVTTAGKNPVQIDRCPRGHGIWFDKGEVEALTGSCQEEGRVVAGLFQDFIANNLKGK